MVSERGEGYIHEGVCPQCGAAKGHTQSCPVYKKAEGIDNIPKVGAPEAEQSPSSPVRTEHEQQLWQDAVRGVGERTIDAIAEQLRTQEHSTGVTGVSDESLRAEAERIYWQKYEVFDTKERSLDESIKEQLRAMSQKRALFDERVNGGQFPDLELLRIKTEEMKILEGLQVKGKIVDEIFASEINPADITIHQSVLNRLEQFLRAIQEANEWYDKLLSTKSG